MNRELTEESRKEFLGLIGVLGSNNAQKIKDVMTEKIIENITDACNDYWFVAPKVIEEMIDEVGEEVAAKMRAKYKKVLTAALDAKIQELIEQTRKE